MTDEFQMNQYYWALASPGVLADQVAAAFNAPDPSGDIKLTLDTTACYIGANDPSGGQIGYYSMGGARLTPPSQQLQRSFAPDVDPAFVRGSRSVLSGSMVVMHGGVMTPKSNISQVGGREQDAAACCRMQ